MARCVDDLELALAVLAPLEPAVSAPTAVAVFEEDGLQPVSATCRAAVRQAAAALGDAGHDVVEARPPGQAAVRGAFDVVLAAEAAAGLLPGVAGREDELSPPIREIVDALRGYRPALAPYLEAFATLVRLEAEADAWLARHGAALCPVAPDVAPPSRGSVRARRRRAHPPGRQAHAVHLRQRARAARGLGPGDALGEAGLPVGVQLIGARGARARAAGAGARARARARRLAGPGREPRACSDT